MLEEWEDLNDHRWYRESLVYSHVLNAGVNQSILENWQCATRNLRREMDIGGKTLHEVEEAARRIRFGEVFTYFNEFELCLDCWCVVNMRASHKFKMNPDCRVRICRYELPARKKKVGKSCEWTPSEPSGSSQGLEPPHVLGVRTFNDFAARRNTPAFPTVRPDRPDLNLEEQVFSQCTQRQKKRVGVKGGCGEKDRYDAAQMVRFTHADSDGDDLDEEDIEGDEEDCDDDPKKVGRKTPSRGTRCEWRVRYRQKGLEKAVAEVLPRNFHMHCAHHLKMNVIKHFRAAVGKAFLTLVYMDSQASHERRLVEMETRSSKGPDLVRYICQIPMDRYVRFAIPLPRYGRTTSNIVECINGALKPVRDYAPCHIIWQMWNYMLNLFYARREKARQSSEELTAFATKRMKEIVQNCGSFVAMSAYENEALVQTDGGRKQWRLTKVPTRNYPIQDDPAMNPAAVMTNVSQEDGGERGNPLMPQSSTPQGEQLSQAPPVARSKGTRCCGACKQPGHTRRTCPALRQYRRAEVHEGLDVAANG
ncbi:hypothetical protein R1sor_019510 [Riccia sorocarpa]|uniref:Transposase n=1 Tax=Riccia sorocarpa TaxID=122646 RepID=A0ABD3ICR1_9MARC